MDLIGRIELEKKNIKQVNINASSGSIIMAVGIFLLGAIHQFSLVEHSLGKYLSLTLLLVWLVMVGLFCFALTNKNYRDEYLNYSIKYFGAGTWIAGTSVICILINFRFPELFRGIWIVSYINIVGWLFFIGCSIYHLLNIIKTNSIQDVHGIILLSTVSTQSIACLLLNVFNPMRSVILMIICLGASFYIVSILLIFKRFLMKNKDIHEWKNTDCIIHGALSITGLSLTQSQLLSVELIVSFWFIVFGLFIFVELMEIKRALSRIREFGIGNGLLVYDISQWARNFTFGMFYYFTFNMINTFDGEMNFSFQIWIMDLLAWVVLALLIIELTLLLKSKVKRTSY